MSRDALNTGLEEVLALQTLGQQLRGGRRFRVGGEREARSGQKQQSGGGKCVAM